MRAGGMWGAPGPSLTRNPSGRAADSAQRPRLAGCTPATSPGSGRWAPLWERGVLWSWARPHHRRVLLHLKPLPALQARLLHSSVIARSPSPGNRSPPRSLLPSSYPQSLRAPGLSTIWRPLPTALGQRLSLHHQHLAPLLPTWHCPLAIPVGPILSDKT